jgi:predicted nucleic acid-binding protein
MSIVVDASLVVAALINLDATGQWAESVLRRGDVVAPHFMPVEVANSLRAGALAGELSQGKATRAHARLLGLSVALLPYESVGPRVWELRHNVTPYDAWYVALAEDLDADLATLDGNLTRSPGPRFLTPAV